MNWIKKNKFTLMAIIMVIALLVVYLFDQFEFFHYTNKEHSILLYQSIYKSLLGLLFVFLMLRLGYRFYCFKLSRNDFLYLVVPGIVIAINNFPISAYLNNRYVFTDTSFAIFLVVLFTFSTALLEEVIFRSVILTSILQMMKPTKKNIFIAIVISSSFFGLMHLINLVDGGAVIPTLQQVGYSFLMGCLWAVVFIRTQSVWPSVLLHFLYNFFGSVLYETGFVINRYDAFTIIVTIMVGVIATIYYVYILQRVNIEQTKKAFNMLDENND